MVIKPEDIYSEIELFKLVTNKKVVKSLGEPILINTNQEWLLFKEKEKLLGFICVEKEKVSYLYVIPEARNKGIARQLLNSVKAKEAVCTKDSEHLFLSSGFKVAREWKNYKKVRKIDD